MSAMSIMINHRIVLASRPVGEAELSNFRLEAAELPALQDGRCWCATTT
jgi:NADPH-dependent curcumin reductase CurA